MYKYDDYYEDHLRKKIQELKYAIDTKDSDMYELIGSIRDVFSSPYISTPIVSPNLVNELWILLTKIFIHSDIYDNKFFAIFAMDDIYLYSRRQNIKLCLKDLEKWREKHNKNNTTEEILECVDDIILPDV